jgi:hypothetical protein
MFLPAFTFKGIAFIKGECQSLFLIRRQPAIPGAFSASLRVKLFLL